MGCRASIPASVSGTMHSITDDSRKSPLCCIKRRDVTHVIRSRDLKVLSSHDEEKILCDAGVENTAASTAVFSTVSEAPIRTGNGKLRLSISDSSQKIYRVKRHSLCGNILLERQSSKLDMKMIQQKMASSCTTEECRRIPEIRKVSLVAAQGSKPRQWKVSNERLGRRVQYLDARWHPEIELVDHVTCRPSLSPGELWTDDQFTCEMAMRSKASEVLWKRPHIIPEDSYRIGKESYDGIFHCQLWKLGRWYDVIIDDYLPICRDTGQLWGAHSTDPDELWVSLVEKAFARFYGSYEAVYGGWAGNAFTALTGGVAEKVKTSTTDPDYPVVSSEDLFTRVRNALSNGAIVSATVYAPDGAVDVGDDATLNGLVGGHAYTVTAASVVEIEPESVIKLLRVRNPWGQGRGEWTGAWSDDSDEWQLVSAEIRREMDIQFEPDGEFWMSLDDYCQYFSTTNICSLSPDFDKDGLDDGLCHVMTILGEWTNSSAESALKNKMQNPRFIITIPDSGPRDDDGFIWVVIQLLQEQTVDQNHLVYCRLDFYQIYAEEPSTNGDISCHSNDDGPVTASRCICLQELTNYTVYTASPGLCYRYRLLPGRYLLLPNYVKDKQSEQQQQPPQQDDARLFCIRVFTCVDISCRQLTENPGVFIQRASSTVYIDRASCQLGNVQCFFGEWFKGLNAGGQISYPTSHINPQYCIEISDTTSGNHIHPVLVALIQESVDPISSIGYFVYKVSPGANLPLDYRYMIKNFDQVVPCTQSGSYSFVQNCTEAHGVYLLDANRPYVIVAFADKPTDVKRYVIVLASQVHCDVTCRSYNTTPTTSSS